MTRPVTGIGEILSGAALICRARYSVAIHERIQKTPMADGTTSKCVVGREITATITNVNGSRLYLPAKVKLTLVMDDGTRLDFYGLGGTIQPTGAPYRA